MGGFQYFNDCEVRTVVLGVVMMVFGVYLIWSYGEEMKCLSYLDRNHKPLRKIFLACADLMMAGANVALFLSKHGT